VLDGVDVEESLDEVLGRIEVVNDRLELDEL
jgi:hypothetical protein